MKTLSSFHSSQVSRPSEDRTAHRRAILAELVLAGGQRDFRAEIRGGNLEADVAMMLGHHAVHRVVEHDIGLAGRETGLDQLLEETARIDRGAHRLVLGRAQVEFAAVAHRAHELVGDQHAMVEIERLAVEVAARLADLEKLLDLRVRDVEITGGRAASQRALADRQRQESMTRTKGMMPLVLPFRPTGSPMPRTLPQ